MDQICTAKKSTGVDWIGDIPSNWELTRLKFLATLAYGNPLSAESRKDGEIDVYGSNGAVGANDEANTVGKTIIIVRKGSFGKLNLSESPVFAIDTTYFIDRRFTEEDIDWLYYLLSCLKLDLFSKDSAVPGLAREEAYDRWCPVPPRCEQQTIASYLKHELSRIDELITRKHRLLELLEEKRLAIITYTVTKGLDRSAPMKDSEIDWLGQIPAHWTVSRVKFLINFITSGSRGWAEFYSDEGPTFLQSGNIGRQMELDFLIHQRVNPPPGAEGTRTAVALDDVLVCITGARTGAIGHVSEPLGEAYINQHIALLRPIKERVVPRFLAYSLWSNVGREQLSLNSYGLKEGLGLQNVVDVLVANPPVAEQEKLTAHLDLVTRRLNVLSAKVHQAIKRLLEYRAALITNAVTGKTDLREFKRREAAE